MIVKRFVCDVLCNGHLSGKILMLKKEYHSYNHEKVVIFDSTHNLIVKDLEQNRQRLEGIADDFEALLARYGRSLNGGQYAAIARHIQ